MEKRERDRLRNRVRVWGGLFVLRLPAWVCARVPAWRGDAGHGFAHTDGAGPHHSPCLLVELIVAARASLSWAPVTSGRSPWEAGVFCFTPQRGAFGLWEIFGQTIGGRALRLVSITYLASLFRPSLCHGLGFALALFVIVFNAELAGWQQIFNFCPGTRANIKEVWAFYLFLDAC